MEELMAALQATESSLKTFEQDLKKTKQQVENSLDPNEKRKRTSSSGLIDYNSAKKVVQKSSPIVAFSKTQRFKSTSAYDLDSSVGSIDSTSTVESNQGNLDTIKKKPTAILFGKSKRFQEIKKDTNREFDLNPKYDTIKKREPGVVIKAPTPVEPKPQIIKRLQLAAKSPQKAGAKPSDDESIETVRLEELARGTCDVSDIFSDTTELGPGAYNVNYAGVEPRRSVGFPKAARFKARSEDTSLDITPRYDIIKKSAPGVRIAAEVPKTEKLIKKKTQEQFYQDLSNQLRRQAPVDNDAAIRKNVPTVALRTEMEGLSEKEKLLRLFNELDKRRARRKVAPGAYDPQDLDEPICTVVYRKSLSPKVLRLPERPPSPTRYYAKDDLIKPSQPAFTFDKEGIDKAPKLEDFDLRKPLDINLNLVKPRAPGAIVLPEHKQEGLPELEEIKRGPGAYELNYELTEKRADIGVIKYPDINENNAREKQMDLANKDVFDADLDPNYDTILPRIPGAIIKGPVELEGPAHMPDSILHPEQWRFYDANLNAVKPEVGDIEFAAGLTRDEFIEKEEDHNQFLAYRARQVKKPVVGQYDVKYTAIEPEEKAVDFNRYPERAVEPVDKDEVDIPGDILILNPEKPKPRLPNIKFDSMIGREEEKIELETEELVLEPSYSLVKPKTVTLVNMNKQPDREDVFGKKVDENQEELLLDVNYKQIDPKVKGIPDIGKTTTREDLEQQRNEEREELVVDPSYKLVKPNTTGAISMDSKTKRFTDENKENIGVGSETTAERIDYNKTLESVKPEKNTVDFDRYAEREATKESRKQKEIQKQLKDLNMRIKKSELPVIEEENFEKYPGENKDKEKKGEKNKFIVKSGKNVKKGKEPVVKKKEPEVEKNDIEPW